MLRDRQTSRATKYDKLSDYGLPVLQYSAFGLQALQDIEPCQRPTGLLDQPTIAQIA